MTIKTKFNFGDIVYLKTDPEQYPRMVVGVSVRPTSMTYMLALGSTESFHYEIEISRQRDKYLDGVN